jgi:hypothetical protein
MPMVAQQPPYTLFIVDDDEPMNPREDCEPFGKMVCWHKRYSLGDEHNHSDPSDFLVDLCRDTVPNDELIQMIKDNKFEFLRFGRDEENEEMYYLESFDDHFNKWYHETDYDTSDFYADDMLLDTALPFLKNSEMLNLLSDYVVILPLYLYDHSGITMNTAGFSCPWDSGQVGWIYTTYDDVRKEYGSLDVVKAENLLKSEVESYDCYLTGQCYGFKLYENDNEIDSCWGFLGSIFDVPKDIQSYLPSECENIIDFLEYHSEVDEDEYLEQALETEDEDEMEM